MKRRSESYKKLQLSARREWRRSGGGQGAKVRVITWDPEPVACFQALVDLSRVEPGLYRTSHICRALQKSRGISSSEALLLLKGLKGVGATWVEGRSLVELDVKRHKDEIHELAHGPLFTKPNSLALEPVELTTAV